MCLYPKLIINPKYKPNKKNGGRPPILKDQRIKYVPAPCGRCRQCLKQKANQWKIRLHEEIKHDNNAQFITLTFTNESILQLSQEIEATGYQLDNAIATLATRRFLERIRKATKKSIKHWLITELGHTGTENIHLHGILWYQFTKPELENYWKYGFVWNGYNDKPSKATPATINYMTKYVLKTDLQHNLYKPKILCSKGIGKKYINSAQNQQNKFKESKTDETYRTEKGYKLSLPTYYKNHTYTEEEKEKLWIQKLDQNIRYLGKKKYYFPDDQERYFKDLQYAQEQNEKLGYGTDEVTWDEKEYQNQLRQLQIEKRKAKASQKRL